MKTKVLTSLILIVLLVVGLTACDTANTPEADNTAVNDDANVAENTAPEENANEAPEEEVVEEPTEEPAPEAVAPEANLTDSCVENYSEDIDYFPNKANYEYAEGITIEYFNNYKVVEVLQPWTGAEETFTYVLVQCGTPAPEDVDGLVIEVPVQSAVTMSTTFLPAYDDLGIVDRIVGLDSLSTTNTQSVVDKIAAGEMVEVGSGAGVNVEAVLDLDPGLIMASGSGYPDYDAHPILLEAGLPVFIVAEWMEGSLIARAEWIKNTGALFNMEAQATEVFDEIVTSYNEMAELAASVEERPTVFANTPYQGTWYMPGGASYVAQVFADAGADYLWADDPTTGSQYLDFETVFDVAQGADFWVNVSAVDLESMLAEDERYADFAAFQNGDVYANTARTNEMGGNDYWESGVSHPEKILMDLIKIFHPELLPDYELYYYQQLP